jgi:hypothetical protein
MPSPTYAHRMGERIVSLDRYRPKGRSAFCPRCRHPVEVAWPWSGWRYARIGWFVVWLCAFAALPLYALDMCFTVPLFLVFSAAIGPLTRLSEQRPICKRCGGQVRPGPRKIEGAPETIRLPRRPRRTA